MRHPALRVTEIKSLFEIDAFLIDFIIIFDKFSEKLNFFKIFQFFHFLAPISEPSFSFLTSINFIDTLFLLHDLSFEIFLSENGLQSKIERMKCFQISISNP